MGKKIILLSLFVFVFVFAGYAFGQELRNQFNKALNSGSNAEAVKVLDQWEKEAPDDAELYVAWFNYYVSKARKEFIAFSKKAKDTQSLTLTKTDSDSGIPEGYINFETYYTDIIGKGFEYADKGIAQYPARLDIRFGKVYMYGQIEKYDKFTDEIIKTIEYSNEIDNKWTWTDNKPVENPKEFMLTAVQAYQVQLYRNFESDYQLLDYMQKIAETVLAYYPDSIESFTNSSLVFSMNEEYDKALKVLSKAEKINPKDTIVLGNIAQVYQLKGKPKKAEKYYKLVIKYGDAKMKEYGKMQIESLKK